MVSNADDLISELSKSHSPSPTGTRGQPTRPSECLLSSLDIVSSSTRCVTVIRLENNKILEEVVLLLDPTRLYIFARRYESALIHSAFRNPHLSHLSVVCMAGRHTSVYAGGTSSERSSRPQRDELDERTQPLPPTPHSPPRILATGARGVRCAPPPEHPALSASLDA